MLTVNSLYLSPVTLHILNLVAVLINTFLMLSFSEKTTIYISVHSILYCLHFFFFKFMTNKLLNEILNPENVALASPILSCIRNPKLQMRNPYLEFWKIVLIAGKYFRILSSVKYRNILLHFHISMTKCNIILKLFGIWSKEKKTIFLCLQTSWWYS